MKVIKQILWLVFAFALIAFLHNIVIAFLHPVGGGEFHQIFAYSGGGRINIAVNVFWEYTIIAWVLCFVFVFFRYPAHWFAVTSVTAFIAWAKWWMVCSFPYQSQAFSKMCLYRTILIPSLVATSGIIAHFMSVMFFGWLRKDKDL